MPAFGNTLPIALLLAATGLAGCTSTGADMAMVAPAASYSYAGGEAALDLPDTMSVLPSSYAGDTPSSLAASMPAAAAMPDAEGKPAEPAPVQVASAASRPAVDPFDPAAYAPPPKDAGLFPDAPPAPRAARVVKPDLSDVPAAPRGEIDRLIAKYAALYEVPEGLVRSVVRRESTFNPKAYNNGHWGLMQIKHATARGMGYDGPAKGLLDAETNLKFAVKYLRGAWLVAKGDPQRADRLYQTGYYYHAKRMGLLEATGLGKDRRRSRGA